MALTIIPVSGGGTGTTTGITAGTVSDVANTSTGYLDLPTGTTAQRPVTPTDGMIRYNSETWTLESYLRNSWVSIVANPPTVTSLQYLLVAGGGGGANLSGAGGAGGLLYATNVTLQTGILYTITIGAGAAALSAGVPGNSGNDSAISVINITAKAGGGGGQIAGTAGAQNGKPGGSGGGGGGSTGAGSSVGGEGVYPGSTYIDAPRQGYNGGFGNWSNTFAPTGGGGGAGGAGNNASGTNGGAGGVGLAYSLIGSSTFYAGGGGGAGQVGGAGGTGGGGSGGSQGGAGTAGTANTGGGGGGGWNATGAGGGSGICIIRYPDSYAAAVTTGSPVIISDVIGYRIYKFTGSGSITF